MIFRFTWLSLRKRKALGKPVGLFQFKLTKGDLRTCTDHLETLPSGVK
jgi:hypothetical protein